jgi:hypothetical protein
MKTICDIPCVNTRYRILCLSDYHYILCIQNALASILVLCIGYSESLFFLFTTLPLSKFFLHSLPNS